MEKPSCPRGRGRRGLFLGGNLMTASELIREINAAGGTVELAPGGRIRVTHVPRHLAGELTGLKPEIVRYLDESNNGDGAREPATTECHQQEPWHYTLANIDWNDP